MSLAATPSAPGRPRLLRAYILAYIVFLYLPIVLIPLFSFNDSVQAAFPLKGFTLDWYRGLAANEALRAALVTSLGIGLAAAFLATLCGLTIAYAELTLGSRLSRLIAALARMPILIPGVVIGISLLIAVNLVGLVPSRLAIVLGHVLVALPTTVIIISGSLKAVPRSIPEVAQDLGASDAVVFRRIMLPLTLPAALSAFMLAFLTSFDEFIVAFFLAGTQPTLPLYIWSQLRFPKSLPMVMALGTAILVTSIVIAGAAEWLRRRGLRRLPH